MNTRYQIKMTLDGLYYDGSRYSHNWTKNPDKKIYYNIAMCSQDAAMLARAYGSVVIVKRFDMPNGNTKELPLKVVTKKEL